MNRTKEKPTIYLAFYLQVHCYTLFILTLHKLFQTINSNYTKRDKLKKKKTEFYFARCRDLLLEF